MTDTVSMKDYIARMQAKGLFADDAPFAEHSPAILDSFFTAMRAYDYDGYNLPVTIAADRYGFFRDALDDERIGLNWALSTWMVDVTVPATHAEFMRDLPALRAALGDAAVMTDTFAFTDGYIDTPDLPALNSPVAAFGADYNAYVEGLSQERRKKYRRFAKDFEGYALDFSLTPAPLTAAELSFGWDQLFARWGDYSALFAFAQTLWAQSVATARPDDALFMRVSDKGRLVFVQTVLRRRGGWVTQSIFKDNEAQYDGIAAYTDFKTIEALCAKGPSFLDPSCRTGFEDPESIGIAKRATVNKDVIKPVFLSGALAAPFGDIAASPALHGKAA